MKFRKILSIITVVLVALIIFLSHNQIIEAWHQLGSINLWILALLLPVQILMYFTAGQVYFSYLKAKKQMKRKTSVWKLMRLSFETNFVNHVIPSGGVSGLSYLAWRLRDNNITVGQAAMMQIVRYGLIAIATNIIILISSVILIFIGAPFWIVFLSVSVAIAMTLFVILFIFIISNKKRIDFFGKHFRSAVNTVVKAITFNRVPELLKQETIRKFLGDLHRDYCVIMQDKKMLRAPFVWSIIYSLCDSSTFLITFFALGAPINFAYVTIAQGISSIIGTLVVTPGGAGFYETAMASYFITGGVVPATAIAATLVTRVVILLGTILLGWGFYQQALLKSRGKNTSKESA